MKNKNQMPICPYCGQHSKLVKGDVIYPHRPDLAQKNFYLCEPCDAYCGCHPGTVNPLGRPANKELRLLRSRAHLLFDRIWKSGRMSRTAAYTLLASRLGIDVQKCHIGMFDAYKTRRTIGISDEIMEMQNEPQNPV